MQNLLILAGRTPRAHSHRPVGLGALDDFVSTTMAVSAALLPAQSEHTRLLANVRHDLKESMLVAPLVPEINRMFL